MNPGNNLTPSSQNNYKYNGKEKQNELGLDQLDYTARFYDPVIARFSAIDKLSDIYAYKSPYDYAENRPVNGVDLDGLEWSSTIDANGIGFIKVNTSFSFNFNGALPNNKTPADYQAAINKSFNSMLLASSNNRISGIVTFNGGNAKALGQVIPVLSIADLGVATNGPNIGGMTGNQNSSVNIYKSNDSIRTPETDPRSILIL